MKVTYPESYNEYFQAAGCYTLHFDTIWGSKEVESEDSGFQTFTLDFSSCCYDMGEDDYRVEIHYDKIEDRYCFDFHNGQFILNTRTDLVKFLIGYCSLEGVLNIE